ncbi:MAG TPA: helix-turn-helix domain-containing protein [Gammaproteobacteria bacterium]|nr:helix-turn-helix domain-containing protein [Gammaproteobacteria bacterium]
MSKKSLGEELVEAVQEAIDKKGRGKIVRSKVNIAAVRKKLGMTQKEFAKQYYIKLQTLRNWEQEKRIPDTTTLAYLTCIASRPKEILKILHPQKLK